MCVRVSGASELLEHLLQVPWAGVVRALRAAAEDITGTVEGILRARRHVTERDMHDFIGRVGRGGVR